MSELAAPRCKPVPRPTPVDVGGKAATLLELQAAGFRVPDFVISPADIHAAVTELGTPLVVRSSATAEDGRNNSFAGQFHSFLNLHSVEEVEQAILKCRESLRQPSVLEYCRKNNVDVASLRMEVIVQRMIEPELAGVAFTVNPVTGAEGVSIEACSGLADGLLAGHQESLAADHPLMREHRRNIETVASQIQRHFGSPQDIEFAISPGTLWVLQARPITRVGFAGDIGEWTNADFRDGGVSSTVCTPLMSSLYQWIWDRSLKDSLRELKLLQRDFVASRTFFGRPYWNLGAVKQCLAVLPGFNERQFDNDLSVEINYVGDGRVTPTTPGRVLRAIPTVLAVRRFLRRQRRDAELLLRQSTETRPPEFVVPDDVESSFRELIQTQYLHVESTYFRTIFAASLAKLDFVSSFPDADVGSLVASLPPLRHMAPVRDLQAMSDRTPKQLSQLIDTYRYHYRIGLDVIFPRWDEDRSFVARMLEELPPSRGNDPRSGFEAAHAELLAKLPRWKHRRFERKLARLRHFLWLREELRDISSHVYYIIRRHVLEISRRRELGDSIFFQTFEEIFSDSRSGIQRNREIYDSYRNFAAPNEIGCGHQLERNPTSGSIRGIAASAGRASGKAFVARSVEEAARMPSGQILVCPYTDPGWTAVLDRVGGVVTETGGMLSHAAILCREYGIPAVLGVTNATRRIPHQTNILVHGGDGRVEIVPCKERED